MEPLIQRKTGGQPGNQNARKHGFYSKVLTHNEKCKLKYASGVDGLDQEIAVLRIKFSSLLSRDGENLRLIFSGRRNSGQALSYQIRPY